MKETQTLARMVLWKGSQSWLLNRAASTQFPLAAYPGHLWVAASSLHHLFQLEVEPCPQVVHRKLEGQTLKTRAEDRPSWEVPWCRARAVPAVQTEEGVSHLPPVDPTEEVEMTFSFCFGGRDHDFRCDVAQSSLQLRVWLA